jgi:polyphenol oxidase
MSGSGAREPLKVLLPQWSAPASVRAGFTLRTGGVSLPPYASLNLGAHVGDATDAVRENRRRLREHLQLPSEPAWIEQVHGTEVCDLDDPSQKTPYAPADAVIARHAGRVCTVQVADCLPVLLAASDGSAIAAAHAGWRGLAAGILEATVARMHVPASLLIAWLGPAIGPAHFEVGEEVRSAFLARDLTLQSAFALNARGRWQCDLTYLARHSLLALGINKVFGGEWCTYSDPARFFSYRRDGQCGRMVAVIWQITD